MNDYIFNDVSEYVPLGNPPKHILTIKADTILEAYDEFEKKTGVNPLKWKYLTVQIK